MTAASPSGTRSSRKRVASPRSNLAGDLCVHGLPAREADLLRDHLVRAGVHVDTDEDETVVRILAWENRNLAVDVILALVERWALDEQFTELPIDYDGRSYRLVA